MNFYLVRYRPRAHIRNLPDMFAWLTLPQANGYSDPDELVEACEDWNGEMIPITVKVGDLYAQEEC